MSEIGKIRQSAVLMTYGPGAIIDFRVPGSGAAVSVVAAGLESWEREFERAGASPQDMRRFSERRLCEKLGVRYFRMPPVAPDKPQQGEIPLALVGERFPKWLQCPKCNMIMPSRRWANEPGNPARFCAPCTAVLDGNKRAYVVPVRFVTACRKGHLDDFPWAEWVHRGEAGCANKKKFKLESSGPGLAGMILSCPQCPGRRSMESVFQPGAHKDCGCSGNRPWLIDATEACDQTPVTMQRGASNLYFPRFDSALVIPPWSEEVVRRLGYRWSEIESITTAEQREQYIGMMWGQIQEDVGDLTKELFLAFVEDKVAESERSRSGNLRWDEYQQFMVAAGRNFGAGDEFDVRSETPPSEIPHLSQLMRVVSLREIRALKSFTRIESLPGSPPVQVQPLAKSGISWLPAIEVRGEGVFLALDSARLHAWENLPAVVSRTEILTTFSESNVINPDNENMDVTPQLGARYLLLHALSHVLMRQLSLQCGYSSASLREMIYVGSGDREMAGLMIYTSTSDSDGTLGGLQRQGESKRFGEMFVEAIRSNEWCASDPLCIKGLVSKSESSSLACCHSCLLAPETSCQDFNRFLDRAMLVGTPEDRSIGFFSGLLTREVE
ncbi:MAG: hypothetical protein RLZZ214_804 [Verrucomicrobiota bacterium]